MADKFSDSDIEAIINVSPNGSYVRTPKDKFMMASRKTLDNLKETLHGNVNIVVTDAMRARGVNVGFDAPENPMNAVEKMKNGLARNTGKNKKQLFGG